MDSSQILEHSNGRKSTPDNGSLPPQLETSKDVDLLTYTFYAGEDGSSPHGPYCQDCMNQMFRSEKLDVISTVYVFTTLGFIPFPTRTLVFMNGMNVPFSIKDIAEDFLVLPCSNCAHNNTKRNTNPTTDDDELRIICTSSGRKRKLGSPPSIKKLPAIIVKEELVSSPISKKMAEDVAGEPVVSISPIINNKIFSLPSSPVAATASEEVSAKVKKSVNSTTAIAQNVPSVNTISTKSSTFEKPTLSTGQPACGILGELMSQFGWLPVVVSTNDNNDSKSALFSNTSQSSDELLIPPPPPPPSLPGSVKSSPVLSAKPSQHKADEEKVVSIPHSARLHDDTATAQNKSSADVTGTEPSTEEKLTLSTGRPAGGILGNLMSKFGSKPVVVSTKKYDDSIQNVNKEPSSVCATNTNVIDDSSFCEIIEIFPANSHVAKTGKPMISRDGTHIDSGPEPLKAATVDDTQTLISLDEYRRKKEKNITRRKREKHITRRKKELGFSKSGLFTNRFPCAMDGLSIPPPPAPPSLPVSAKSSAVISVGPSQHEVDEEYVPSMPLSARLQDEFGLGKDGAFGLKVFNRIKERGQGSSKTQSLVREKIDAVLPPTDGLGCHPSDSVTERLKSGYGTTKLLKENILDSMIVEEARNSVKENGHYNAYLMIPFFAGRMNEDPSISFEKLYDGIEFLKYCGMSEHKRLFAKFMCKLFPEINNIRRCDYCEICLPHDASGEIYISHFYSFGHIIQAMNKGCGLLCDFISLKKCLLSFLSTNGFRGYAELLSGPKLTEHIDRRHFSSTRKDFPFWRDLLKK